MFVDRLYILVLTAVWFRSHQPLTLLTAAGDLVLFQFEAEVSLERWRSSTEHLSRRQLARAMEALGAATRYPRLRPQLTQ